MSYIQLSALTNVHVFWLRDTVEGLDMSPGQLAKQNYAYTKHGSCCVLAAIEPLTGKPFAQVLKYRKKKQFALFMQALPPKIGLRPSFRSAVPASWFRGLWPGLGASLTALTGLGYKMLSSLGPRLRSFCHWQK